MIKKIISGGQTGADQAALDFAIAHNIPHGGWIPIGRKTEEGPLADKYQLQEISTDSYDIRTGKNVLDADGTLIISHGKLTGGSALTYELAEMHKKPWIHIDLDNVHRSEAARLIAGWAERHHVSVLNVAGARKSKDPKIYQATFDLLEAAWSQRSFYYRGASNKATASSEKTAYFSFAIVGLALLMSSVDTTIVAVSLRTILSDLRTNLAWVGWTMTGYQFSQSVAMPLAGKLSDDWGRKRLFLVAVVIFTLSSLAAGLSPNIYWLVFFRIIQGVGGGIFLPAATGIVSDAFGKRRAPAIGLFASIFPIGGIVGPNIGGFIIDHYSWRWIFFVNIPIGVVLLICGWALLPKSTATLSKHGFDTVGAGLFSSAVLIILYATTNWAEHAGEFGIMTGLLFAAGAILLYLFIRHEGKVKEPMIELKLLRWRPLMAVNIYNFIFGAVVFGLFSFIPYYAAIAYGMTAGETGILLTPRALAMITVSAITSLFIIRLRYRLPMIVGLTTIALSLLLLSQGYHDISIGGIGLHNLVILTLLVSLQGIGTGISNPAANNAAIDLIPEKTSTIIGLRGMFRSIGGVFGTAGLVFALSCYSDKVLGLQQIFRYMALLLLLLIPIVFMIPDKTHKSL